MFTSRDDRTGPSRPLGMAWAADGSSLVTCGQTHKESPPLVFWVKDASTGSFANKRYIYRCFVFGAAFR